MLTILIRKIWYASVQIIFSQYKVNLIFIIRFTKYAFNILGPDINNQIFIPNILIVPLLGFDHSLNRLGYGGGFYDKLLESYNQNNHKFCTIGLAFDF